MAFGGDGSGGGNIVPSFEPVTTLAGVEVGEEGLVTEDDIVVREGAVEEGAFGDVVDAVVDGLRTTIRALGGMLVTVREGRDAEEGTRSAWAEANLCL